MVDKSLYNKYTVIVIGDGGIDRFVYGNVLRIAPEAPVPVFNPISKKENKGMASNVYENLKSIGINSILISNEEEIIKTRYVDDRSNQLLIRIDENDKVKKIDEKILKSIKNNQYNGEKIDAIIISDYDKGFLDENSIKFISENNWNVFLDTKKILDDWCLSCSFIKINHVEYNHTKFNLKNLDLDKKLIITMSEKGCMYDNNIFPVEKVNIKDVSGAGDTFISGLVSEFVRTNNIEQSIKFAQKCATIVVQKKGVCTI
jgi:D-beta-D-heptose 7-phosphate kinase/D-beta-D-heptose 1-phosphate adenosyltransferase